MDGGPSGKSAPWPTNESTFGAYQNASLGKGTVPNIVGDRTVSACSAVTTDARAGGKKPPPTINFVTPV
jgi:hypothetical protein